MRHTIKIFVLPILCLVLVACGINSSINIADGTTVNTAKTTVNGGVFIGENCTVNAGCRTVNGRVVVGDNSKVSSLHTVNGSMSLGNNIVVDGNLEAVNGRIELGGKVTVEGDVETVNGSLQAGIGSLIHGAMRTVNGDINLEKTEVNSEIMTSNGNISLNDGSRVTGNIVIKGENKFETKPVTILISGSSVVEGDIVIRDAQRKVTLVLEDGGEVRGSTGTAVVEQRASDERLVEQQ